MSWTINGVAGGETSAKKVWSIETARFMYLVMFFCRLRGYVDPVELPTLLKHT